MSTDTLFPRHRSGILHTRAISDRIIDSQPDRYLSFEGGDWETFFRLMRINLSRWPKTKVSAWKGKVTASGGGVVVKRFDVNGAPTAPPYARLERDVLFGDPRKGAKPIHYAVVSTRHTAMSSTSVTTWESKDLKRLLRLLRGATTVYVVPDSDFIASEHFEDPETGIRYFNPSVYYFTRVAAQWLVNSRVNAKIAYPWTTETKDGAVDKLGVDDFLARHYALEDLTVEDAYPGWQDEYFDRGLKITPSERRFLEWLLKHQGNRGAFRPGEIARQLGLDRQTILRGYKRFEQLGFMRVWEGWAVETDNGYRTRPHAYVMFELIHGYWDWVRSIRVPLPVRRKLGVTPLWTPANS